MRGSHSTGAADDDDEPRVVDRLVGDVAPQDVQAEMRAGFLARNRGLAKDC